MSPLRSSAGPATWRMPTPSSLRTICASEVLPSPGGPASRTWSSASPRAFAASSAIASCSLTRSCPTKSSSVRGRSDRSSSSSPPSSSDRREELLAHAAFLRAARTCSSTGSDSSTSASARSASISVQPSSTSASRASERRLAGTAAVDVATSFSFSSSTTRCAVLQADPGIAWKRVDVVARDRAAQLGRRRAGDDRERDLRADAGDAEQQLEQLALVGGREAVELQRVLADDACGSRPSPRRRRGGARAASRRRGSRRRRRRRSGPRPRARRRGRAAARSRRHPRRERRHQRVADRDGERVRGVVRSRDLRRGTESPSPSSPPAACRRGRSRRPTA